MPRPNESPDVKASKALAYILRHGAEKEGLDMRQDGFLKLKDVVSCFVCQSWSHIRAMNRSCSPSVQAETSRQRLMSS
jgi:RNA:NAD 2'-phosphotransferase (TPT1/KptA family)